MSNHLIDCAKLVQGLAPSHKLLLLCLADNSRDGSGRIASPGMDEAATWTGLEDSALYDAFKALRSRGLITQHQRGQKGRVAEYLLFPEGCCDVHQRLDRQSLPGLSASGLPEAETRVQGPADRRLSEIQPPASRISASGLAGSASGLDRRPSQVLPKELPSPTPRDRTAPPSRAAVVEAWTRIFANRAALEEFASELRTIRRGLNKPTARWTTNAIRAAIAKAVDAGWEPTHVPAAFRAVAHDRDTDLPGRLAVAGAWWDEPEAQDLAQRRSARAETERQEQAARAAARASCGCDSGWIHQGDERDRVVAARCPNCNPRSHTG